jgi:heat shock protein HslJ
MILFNIKKSARIAAGFMLIAVMFSAVSARDLRGEWRLVKAILEGRKIPLFDSVKTTMVFGVGNKVFGSGGCNLYSTTYDLKGREKIAWGLLITTKRACTIEPGEQEGAFFNALEKVNRYKIKGNRLILFNAAKQNVLTFTRQR